MTACVTTRNHVAVAVELSGGVRAMIRAGWAAPRSAVLHHRERKPERFESHATAKKELFDYIEVFYNQRRRHSTLGYVSPAQYERINGALKERLWMNLSP